MTTHRSQRVEAIFNDAMIEQECQQKYHRTADTGRLRLGRVEKTSRRLEGWKTIRRPTMRGCCVSRCATQTADCHNHAPIHRHQLYFFQKRIPPVPPFHGDFPTYIPKRFGTEYKIYLDHAEQPVHTSRILQPVGHGQNHSTDIAPPSYPQLAEGLGNPTT